MAVIHAETSTGVRNPIAEIGELLKGSDTIYLVDTVTSLGGIEVRMDDWNIDALYSGTRSACPARPALPPFPFPTRPRQSSMGAKRKCPTGTWTSA